MDTKFDIIKYQGTNNFLAALLCESETKKYYFWFMPTKKPVIELNHETDYAYSALNFPLMTFDKDQISFIAEGIPFGKNKQIFSLMAIEATEFNTLCKLLECIYDD